MEGRSEKYGIMRIFAMIGVIAMHTLSSYASGSLIASVWTNMGLAGVPVFLFLGGFFYRRQAGDSRSFWKKKAKTLILPWLVCAGITYLISLAYQPSAGLSAAAFARWTFGIRTWLWYMPVYLLLLAIFRFLRNSPALLILSVALNVLSLLLCSLGVYLEFWGLTVYQNPLNWMGFFAMGILARRYGADTWLTARKKWLFPLSAALWALSLAALVIQRNDSYFSISAMAFETVSIPVIFYLSDTVAMAPFAPFLERRSREIFCIYLYHIQIVQFLCRFLPKCAPVIAVIPLLCYGVMAVLVAAAVFLCGKMGKAGIFLTDIVGIRTEKRRKDLPL